MIKIFLVALGIAFANNVFAEENACVLDSGESFATPFPCKQEMVDRFARRVIEIYPEVKQINTSADYMKGLYVFAMGGCTGHFRKMTPEEIGKSGEPFFPSEIGRQWLRQQEK
jgi:hypothetical protein